MRCGTEAVQLVSVASAHSRETASIVLSILADRIFPFAKLTLIWTSKVSLPTSARYLPFDPFSTSTQLLAVAATGGRIHSTGILISGFSGGTCRTRSVAILSV